MGKKAMAGGMAHVGLVAGTIATPLGPMVAIVDLAGALVRLDFSDDARALHCDEWAAPLHVDPGKVRHVATQLDQYFAGQRRQFTLVLAPRGSPFLQRAWHTLAQVAYGTTSTYGALASRIAPPSSARAVGRANAINPISIVIPCHRILAADGGLAGYSGGLHRKTALLEVEGVARQPALFHSTDDFLRS